MKKMYGFLVILQKLEYFFQNIHPIKASYNISIGNQSTESENYKKLIVMKTPQKANTRAL